MTIKKMRYYILSTLMALGISVVGPRVVEANETSSVVPQDSTGSDLGLLSQVTSVQQLSDVGPSDWAFQALQNLVETYGCLQGYPDGTFRGDRSLTRYEFAAGLNACLDVLGVLINQGQVAESDLEALQRLTTSFETELAELGGRIDALEADVAGLQAQAFSTTTKLTGLVDVHLNVPIDTFEGETSTNITSRAHLNFDTSFTGRDRLRIQLLATSGDQPLRPFLGLSRVNGLAGSDPFDLRVDDFYYRFPAGDRIDIALWANGLALGDIVTTRVLPFSGNVALVGSPRMYGTGMGGGAGLGVSLRLSDQLVFDAGYTVASGPAGDPAIGIAQGSPQSYIGQLTYLGQTLQLGVVYAHGVRSTVFEGGLPGAVDTFGGLFRLTFGDLALGGYAAYSDFNGGDDFFWILGGEISDALVEGGNLGLYGGQTPQLTGSASNPVLIEAYYDFPVSRNLRLTPALIYGNANFANDDDGAGLYGIVRASFRF